jgi:gliding motility-associated-like protein
MRKRLRYNNPLPNLRTGGEKSFFSPPGETGKGVNILLIIILSVFSLSAFSQTGCTVPLPPVLTSVSVQPETEKTDLIWNLSPSPDIAAYIVYTYKEPDGLPIDTIWNPLATNYTVTSTGTKYFSISYVVTAYRLSTVAGEDGCASPLSNVLSTIFCSSAIDTCNRRISVAWNKYTDFPKPVKEYKVLVSVNGSTLSEMYTVGKNADSYTITDFITDSQYCIAVKAVFDDGTFSASNKSCLSTKMQRPPDWINADFATVNAENKISLSFTVDPVSEIKSFSLSRKTGASGTFTEISKPVYGNGKIIFTDSEAKTGDKNYYRLSAINSCNVPVTISNICSNIVLDLERKGDDLILLWNGYKEWQGSVSEYKLFINTGDGFTVLNTLSVYDTLLKLGYKDIMYKVSEEDICFYIEAYEASNPHGIRGQSRSAQICTVPEEIITVPNVFTPDSDLLNDSFKPVLSFTPKDYHLVITDRNGRVLFETRNHLEEWDGTHNGHPQSQGVNLWFLKVTTPSGRTESKTGTVTIVRNR